MQMTDSVKARLKEMGLELPESSAPVANYVSQMVVDGMIYMSGQLPLTSSGLSHTGLLGKDVDLDTGIAVARLAGLQVIAKLNDACEGDLDRIEQIVQLNVFVASTPDFYDQPKIANGVSDLMVEVFGERGRHTRNAVGMASLPLNAPVEVGCIAKMKA